MNFTIENQESTTLFSKLKTGEWFETSGGLFMKLDKKIAIVLKPVTKLAPRDKALPAGDNSAFNSNLPVRRVTSVAVVLE